eukprot:jgi/Chlat1/232/Chrsp1S03042
MFVACMLFSVRTSARALYHHVSEVKQLRRLHQELAKRWRAEAEQMGATVMAPSVQGLRLGQQAAGVAQSHEPKEMPLSGSGGSNRRLVFDNPPNGYGRQDLRREFSSCALQVLLSRHDDIACLPMPAVTVMKAKFPYSRESVQFKALLELTSEQLAGALEQLHKVKARANSTGESLRVLVDVEVQSLTACLRHAEQREASLLMEVEEVTNKPKEALLAAQASERRARLAEDFAESEHWSQLQRQLSSFQQENAEVSLKLSVLETVETALAEKLAAAHTKAETLSSSLTATELQRRELSIQVSTMRLEALANAHIWMEQFFQQSIRQAEPRKP